MKKIVLGILAHVDAGKTTLSEGILYTSGNLEKPGRVDNRDSYLDYDAIERARGITVFSKQAGFTIGKTEVTLLDTPGHVDFAAEMERTLQVLDYAILVISGSDGVQGHTKTLWRLLRHYDIPTFLFVNKMDQPDNDKAAILKELQALSENCIAFTDYQDGIVTVDETYQENVAMLSDSEAILEQYMETEQIPDTLIPDLIQARKLFPCYFGSALKMQGIDELLNGIERYTKDLYSGRTGKLGARVYKITRDDKGNRLTHMKIMQGSLSVRDAIGEEKVTQIRIYNGESYSTTGCVTSGDVCTVTGPSKVKAGDGIGEYADNPMICMEPVLAFTLSFEEQVSPRLMFTKLKELEEEFPELNLSWSEETETIQVMLMGEVQIEILTQVIRERLGIVPTFDTGKIVYKETIAEPVIGVGHFEPLRHYAEVHILMEPGEIGSGIDVTLACSEDVLSKNWQRLIKTHLLEKKHVGIKLGAPLTDVHFTVINGRAHLKHTEGGDFRQATYRAVRQGLMEAGTVILEPEYNFVLEIPASMLGRAMTDLEALYAVMEAPEQDGEKAVIHGHGPVATMRDYQIHVRKYTKGMGNFQVSFRGYAKCHNEEEVMSKVFYNLEADLKNPASSVFCAHGSGFLVPWDQVKAYMHVKDETESENTDEMYVVKSRENFDYSIGLDEIDAILAKTTANKNAKKQIYKKKFAKAPDAYTKSVQTKPVQPREKHLLVDGYNVIFAWEELHTLADTDMNAAKNKLVSLLSNYQGIVGEKTTIVFDGYKVKGNHGSTMMQEEIEVIHTRENQTADQFIEAYTHEHTADYDITVVTSDGLIQTITRGNGCHIVGSHEFYNRMEEAAEQLREQYGID